MTTSSPTVAVVGAGTMGAGIAQLCVQAGLTTLLYDLNTAMLDRARQTIANGLTEQAELTADACEAALTRLKLISDLAMVEADVIIEAVVEKLNVKQRLFQELALFNSPATIFASITSTFSIAQLAAPVPHPERVVGMHFFNPAPLMPLVEVISGAVTSPAAASQVQELAMRLGKQPVLVADAPGFIVNRVAQPYYLESLQALEERAASPEAIDDLLEATGFRTGPFRLMDQLGVDTNFAITISLFEAFYHEPRFRPSRLQQQKVDAGQHGRKTGRGFYQY